MPPDAPAPSAPMTPRPNLLSMQATQATRARATRAPGLLPLALLAAGCAADRHVVLPSLAAADVPIEAAAGVLEAPPFTISVVDERREPGIVGEVRGLWNMRIARVESEGDVALWVRDALAAALAARGAEVLPGSADGAEGPEPVVLEARLERVFCSELDGYRAEVLLRAEAHVGARLVLRTKAGGSAVAEPGPDRGGSVHAGCLRQAVDAAAASLADELLRALRERPPVGQGAR